MIPRRPAGSAKAETPGSGAETGPRGVESTHVSVSSVVVEPVGALDPILAAGNVELLQFLEVGHASHHVVAFGRLAGLHTARELVKPHVPLLQDREKHPLRDLQSTPRNS